MKTQYENSNLTAESTTALEVGDVPKSSNGDKQCHER